MDLKHLLLCLLLITGVGLAQDTDDNDVDIGDGVELEETATGDTTLVVDDQYYAGASIGYPGFNLHFGIDNLADNLDGRATLALNYGGSFLELQAAGLYGLPITLDENLEPLTIYVGGGPVIGIGGGFTLGLNVLGGGEYRLAQVDLPQGGVFLELGPQIDFVGADNVFGYTGRAGFNYHF